MNDVWSLESASPEATTQLGRRLGQAALPGLVVSLIGPLGAGKTWFTRGVAEGLDVPDPRLVCSPTFVLLQIYEGRLPIYHFDTYRLDSPAQFARLGPEEYFEGDGICLVEWADRVSGLLPVDRLEVRIEVTGPEHRRFEMRASGARATSVLQALRAAVKHSP
jgi:tRNA threonylcarbamoyladenosine biosynthesis protein TsaE